jgi:hypothetical protein
LIEIVTSRISPLTMTFLFTVRNLISRVNGITLGALHHPNHSHVCDNLHQVHSFMQRSLRYFVMHAQLVQCIKERVGLQMQNVKI